MNEGIGTRLSDRAAAGRKLGAWLLVARFPFYPMAFAAYAMGAAAAAAAAPFSPSAFVLGYAALFLIEFCTILANEYYDYETDRLNANFSIFTGGTRMLVEGRLSPSDIRAGIAVSLVLIALLGSALPAVSRNAPPLLTAAMLLTGIFFGLGYTVPPFKFCYRGLGELVVSGTHSFYLVLCGYVFQAGTLSNALPWLLSLPLFFSVLGAITLAGLPDRPADSLASKRTVAVIFGPGIAAFIACCCVALAALSGALLFPGVLAGGGVRTAGTVLIALYACTLLWVLSGMMRSKDYDRRINGVMALALGYVIWFAAVPLASFL
ncbi:MAG TPA: prenyltransferase [Syntrophales bacterium]|nr:prenyltransferase [Syntrophales bacterium]